jgi:hypothetical protein
MSSTFSREISLPRYTYSEDWHALQSGKLGFSERRSAEFFRPRVSGPLTSLINLHVEIKNALEHQPFRYRCGFIMRRRLQKWQGLRGWWWHGVARYRIKIWYCVTLAIINENANDERQLSGIDIHIINNT